MTDKQKNWVIALLLVGLFITSYIAIFNHPQVLYDKELLEKQIKELEQRNNELEKQNAKLQKDFESEIKKATTFTQQIDSLQNLKPKIKYVYIEKYKTIDRAGIVSNDSLLRASLNLGK